MRPHQETASFQLAITEPVVRHHGRQHDTSGHDEARPPAATACWAALFLASQTKQHIRGGTMLGRATDSLAADGLPDVQVDERRESWIELALYSWVGKALARMRDGIALGTGRDESCPMEGEDLF
jgi:hypothetical protein